MTTTTDAIYSAIRRIHLRDFKGIGIPLIQIPAEEMKICFLGNEPAVFITMAAAVRLAESILDMEPASTLTGDER